MSRRRHGLSLVEILVTSAVMVVTLVPLFVLFSGSVRTTEVSIDELRATNLATEVISQMRLLAGEPGFGWIDPMPPDLTGPDDDRWVPLDDPESPLYQQGMSLASSPESTGPGPFVVDTRGWTLVGAPFARDPSIPADPWIESLSRLYLSPAPPGTRRFVRVFIPRMDSQGTLNPNLKRLEVRVEWERTFIGTPTQRRHLELRTLLGNPRAEIP